MGVVVFMVQNALKGALAQDDPIKGVQDIFKDMGVDNPEMDYFIEALMELPGGLELTEKMAKDPEFMDAILHYAKPGYMPWHSEELMIGSLTFVAQLYKEIRDNPQCADGFQRINEALEDPAQREVLLEAIKEQDQSKVSSFLAGKAPEQLYAQNNDAGIKNAFTAAAEDIKPPESRIAQTMEMDGPAHDTSANYVFER